MSKNTKLIPLAIIILSLSFIVILFSALKPTTHPAGIRASFNGFEQGFPTAERLEEFVYNMSYQLADSVPTLILVVGGFNKATQSCHLYFPSDKTYPYMEFDETDSFESYLDYLDSSGIKVFLQVEPGNASISDLIDIVLSRYQHHPSVIGFGTDIEWHDTDEQHPKGKPVANATAKRWEVKVKSYNPDYRLFLKHWETEKMPDAYRGDLIFVNNAQNYPSQEEMLADFANWSEHFSDSDVFYQFGYKSDISWWNNLSNPPEQISQAILDFRKDAGLFWVDFSIDHLEKKYHW